MRVPLELVCFDLAGTTVADDGAVLQAFRLALQDLSVGGADLEPMERYVIETMGQSKIEVFTHLFGSRAEEANLAFERRFDEGVRAGGVREIPGARAAFDALVASGVAVALTTGFSPATRDLLLDQLGWSSLPLVAISPADAGRGRPTPDMVLTCALRCAVTSVAAVAVVGDTASDMQAGRRAGAGLCIGVRTGADAPSRLLEAGADVVCASVAAVPELLGIDPVSAPGGR